MFYREILKVLSSYFFLYAAILVVPLAFSLYYQFFVDASFHPQPHATMSFVFTIMICLVVAFISFLLSYDTAAVILHRREALLSAVIIWVLTPAIGALPFILSGTLERFDLAYLEAASGFTTTGTTVMEAKRYDPQTGKEVPIEKTYCDFKDATYTYYGTIKPVIDPYTGKTLEGVEAVSRVILFWRSLTGWLGGVGIIVLFVAFLPALGIKGKFLFQTETPGPIKEGIAPRIKETAVQLWKIYTALTLLQIMLLIATNAQMPVFDAVNLAMSTVSTGGFAVHDYSIAYYDNANTQWIIFIFMLLGSLNFALYYYIFKGKIYRLFEPQFLFYLAIILVFGSFISWQLVGTSRISLRGEDLGVYSAYEAIRDGFFQLMATQTSSGLFISNYDTWPVSTQLIMLVSMFIGGMSGSAAGGIKVIRLYILFQIVKDKLESIFNPRTIKILRVGQREIDSGTAISVLCLFFLMIAMIVAATLLYVLDHIDLVNALILAVTTTTNTGLGFYLDGPDGTLAFMSPFSAYFSAFLMIMGRLEFYVVLALLLPNFWKKY